VKHQLHQTLNTVLAQRVQDHDLAGLVDMIASACWSIARAVRTSALDGNLGATDRVNVQGEDQKPLDILANDLFMQAIGPCARVAAALSEEVDNVTWLKAPEQGDFLLSFDPVDGSSNLDVNMAVGSIFAITRVKEDGDKTILHKGRDVVCVGYAIYGPATMFVLTFGNTVDGFTLDADQDSFVLTHPNMRIPQEGAECAINASRQQWWDAPTKSYVDQCLAG
jgi:fructose-1,6-bisphosphatase I